MTSSLRKEISRASLLMIEKSNPRNFIKASVASCFSIKFSLYSISLNGITIISQNKDRTFHAMEATQNRLIFPFWH